MDEEVSCCELCPHLQSILVKISTSQRFYQLIIVLPWESNPWRLQGRRCQLSVLNARIYFPEPSLILCNFDIYSKFLTV